MLEIELIWILCYLLLGGVVGFLAGMLGIGGGGIMVPMLTSFFIWQGIAIEHVVHLALGTSMATIVPVSLSSMRAHQKKRTILWPIVRRITPGVIIGAFATTFFVAHLNTLYLSIFFTLFMFYVSIQMFLNLKPKSKRSLPSAVAIASAGGVIGSLSTIVSIGGGSLLVPYMTWHSVTLKKAISTSAAIGFPISLVGSIGYIINGFNTHIDLPYTFGYVNLLAVCCMTLVSYFIAPIGAHFSQKIATKTLRKIFAILLVTLSIKMFISII